MDRAENRVKKKGKVIPKHFHKKSNKNNASLSQILQAGLYKRHIQDLKKNNKHLAVSLEDAHCKIASQESQLKKYVEDCNQMMFARMKIKDMVATIQKLVTDMDEVANYLNVRPYNLLNDCTSHEDMRLKIRIPDVSRIEESASNSTIEANASTAAYQSLRIDNSSSLNMPSFQMNNSATEIYFLPSQLAASAGLKGGETNESNQGAGPKDSLASNGSNFTSSPHTPQLEISRPIYPMQVAVAIEKSSDISQLSAETAANPDKSFKPFHSKIPTKKKIAHLNVCSLLPEPDSNNANRRETFVILRNDNASDTTASDRRGTFVQRVCNSNETATTTSDPGGTCVQRVCISNETSKAALDRRGTFVKRVGNDDEMATTTSDQRGTFVQKVCNNESVTTALDRRGTFVLHTLPQKDHLFNDRRGTYLVPIEHIKVVQSKSPVTHSPLENVSSNRTVFLCEDMELTEVLPLQALPNNEELEIQEPLSFQQLLMQEKVPSPNAAFLSVDQVSADNGSATTIPAFSPQSPKNASVDKNRERRTSLRIKAAISPRESLLPSACLEESVDKTPELGIIITKGIESEVSIGSGNLRTVYSKKSLAKKKSLRKATNAVIERESLKGRLSSMSAKRCTPPRKSKNSSSAKTLEKDRKSHKRVSLAIVQPPRFSAVEKDAENPASEEENPIKVHSFSPRSKASICYAKYFASSDAELGESSSDEPEQIVSSKRFSLVPGRKVVNANNKKIFVFKASRKSVPLSMIGDGVPEPLQDDGSKIPTEDNVFTFVASPKTDVSSKVGRKSKKSSKSSKGNKSSVLPGNEGSVVKKRPSSKIAAEANSVNTKSSKSVVNKRSSSLKSQSPKPSNSGWFAPKDASEKEPLREVANSQSPKMKRSDDPVEANESSFFIGSATENASTYSAGRVTTEDICLESDVDSAGTIPARNRKKNNSVEREEVVKSTPKSSLKGKSITGRDGISSSRKSVRFAPKGALEKWHLGEVANSDSLSGVQIENDLAVKIQQSPVTCVSPNSAGKKSAGFLVKKKYGLHRRSSLKQAEVLERKHKSKRTSTRKTKKSNSFGEKEKNFSSPSEIVHLDVISSGEKSQKTPTSNLPVGNKIHKKERTVDSSALNHTSDPAPSKKPLMIPAESENISSGERDSKSNLKGSPSIAEDVDGPDHTASKLSEAEEISKTKRPFSGVSERRSKRRSTATDLLEEIGMVNVTPPSGKSDPPNVPEAVVDNDLTEIYPLDDIAKIKVPHLGSERECASVSNGTQSSKPPRVREPDTKKKTVKRKAERPTPNHHSSDIKKATPPRGEKRVSPKRNDLEIDVLSSTNLATKKSRKGATLERDRQKERGRTEADGEGNKKPKPKKSRKTANVIEVKVISPCRDSSNLDICSKQPSVILEQLPLCLHSNRCTDGLCATASKDPLTTDNYEGRSRRAKPAKSFKEPSLHTKMRR